MGPIPASSLQCFEFPFWFLSCHFSLMIFSLNRLTSSFCFPFFLLPLTFGAEPRALFTPTVSPSGAGVRLRLRLSFFPCPLLPLSPLCRIITEETPASYLQSQQG